MARVVARAGSTWANLLTGTCVDDVGLASPTIVGCILTVAGASIRVWCYRALGWLFTFETIAPPAPQAGHVRSVRHRAPPLVHGRDPRPRRNVTRPRGPRGADARVSHGVLPWTIFWSLLTAILCTMMVDWCIREDRVLHSAFGREWEAWSGRVQWRLVPWVY